MCRSRMTSETWKHPHGRGEDCVTRSAKTLEAETPPRAWGRLLSSAKTEGCNGNTPTGVGKTRCHPG